MIVATLIILFFISFILFFASTTMYVENFFNPGIPKRLIRQLAWYSILFSAVGIIFGIIVR